MRIAVTYENGQVFQHFGHTERFKMYDVENGEVTLSAVVNTVGSGHGALPDVLKKRAWTPFYAAVSEAAAQRPSGRRASGFTAA